MSAALPTLSQIEAWDVEHLHAAAAHWTARATAWEQAYTAAQQQARHPGGRAWQGRAAEAAHHRIGTDRLIAVTSADVLHGAAAVARTGAEDVYAAQHRALAAIGAARADGFDVTDDLSIDDLVTSSSPAVEARRHVQAFGHATEIWAAAEHLAVTDRRVGAQISSAATGLDSSAAHGDPISEAHDDVIVGQDTARPHIQLVDGPVEGPTPQEPVPPPPVTGAPIRLPPRSTPPPIPVIDLGIQPEPPARAGFPNCGTEDVLKAWGSIIAGGTLAGVSVPGEAVTAGAATAGIMGGGMLIWEGADTLERCK